MNAEEGKVLQEFLDQLVQARGVAKDPQADALISKAAAQQPDAAYLLVQRALLLDHALTQSRAQIATLQQELQAARAPNAASASSFLDPGSAWGRSAADMPRAPIAPATQYPVPPTAMQNPAPAAAARPGFFGSNAGSLLSNVATTAAGVAGGAFLFQGIEHLLGQHNQAPGFFGASSLMDRPVENTTVNNFFSNESASSDANDDPLNVDYDDDSTDDGLTSI